MEKELLDSDKAPELSITQDMILWWERKRIYYNIILLIGLYLGISGLESRLFFFGIGNAIQKVLIFLIMANLCYMISWVPAVIMHRLLNYKGYYNTGRWVLFAIGSFISLFFAIFTGIMLVDGFAN